MAVSGATLQATIGTSLRPGTYLVSVRARDMAGNWSAVETVTLTVRASRPPHGSWASS